jgi:type VI secretion system secreted protein VgrG
MAQNSKANEAQFFFFCSGLPADTFEVMNFSGTDSINSPYSFDITLISLKADIAAEKVVNKQATLVIFREGEYFPYSGIIANYRFVDKSAGRATYVFKLVSKLWLLRLTRQSRVFQKMTAPAIIKKVFEDAKLSDYITMKVDEGKYGELEYIVQYQESDLNFITRIMENSGMWYFFEEHPMIKEEMKGEPGVEKLFITDAVGNFKFIEKPVEIAFRSESGMTEQDEKTDTESVNALHYIRTITPSGVITKDYNYRTPEVSLNSQKTVKTGDVGTVYEYAGHFKNVTDADNSADAIAKRLSTMQITIDGECNCRAFRAGKRFTVTKHFRDDFNTTYIVTNVVHLGAHLMAGQSGRTVTYSNQFRCLPADRADSYRPAKRAITPKLPGIITAQIEANGSSYADLDEMGRYKVRMPFDLSKTKNHEGSRYIRLAQPYSGQNYGMHFPSHEGAEMVLACIDGNPDRPLGLATVPHANTPSPVVSANQQQNVIRTAGGNEFVLDDTDKKQKARLTTSAKHTLEMDDENRKISLKSTDESELLFDDKNELVKWTTHGHTMTMTYKGGSEGIVINTTSGHTIALDDKNKKISIHSKGGHSFEMDDGGKTIVMADSAGKNKVTLDGNGGIILDSQGKIEIKAQQDVEIKGANVKINGTMGSVEATATTDMKLKGMNLDAGGDMSAKVKGGMTLELSGGTQAKLSGTMLDMSGSAMAKLQGGMVMIN